jgi:methyl-accepting chemotaxis protein
LTANDNFLQLTGYTLDSIVGRHHSMFVSESDRQTPEYASFWKDLARGAYHAAEFKRVASDGSDVWLRATYNPVFDLAGEPF